jgi:hypothetical protein
LLLEVIGTVITKGLPNVLLIVKMAKISLEMLFVTGKTPRDGEKLRQN